MKYGIIGYGSWATALVSVITQKHNINWWLPDKNFVEHIRKHKKNPKYLPDSLLNTEKIQFYPENPGKFTGDSDIIFVVVPSAYVDIHLQPFKEIPAFGQKLFISCVKGFEITTNKIVSEYLTEVFNINPGNIAAIGGPAHAEEVIKQKETVVTLAFAGNKTFNSVAEELQTPYFRVLTSNDIVGIEYAAILKNIYAMTIGVLLGLGAGDNFIAMAVCSCLNEMEDILEQLHPVDLRTVIHSAYLGDFLVTAYSQHSRNRRFGLLVGQGNSVEQATQKLQMVAEGYFATKILVDEYFGKHNLSFPIVNSLYDVLYKGAEPEIIIEILPRV